MSYTKMASFSPIKLACKFLCDPADKQSVKEMAIITISTSVYALVEEL